MVKIKVSDLIAEFLERAEIKVVFGIIGSANSHIFDSITKRKYTEIVCVHHEQAAVMAMGAYFRASGKMSAAIVTAGAGSSNAITGVVSNWADSIPGIIISGQEQSEFLHRYERLRMYGIQGFNSPKMVESITKYAKTLTDENSVQNELERAHFLTQTQRPGPVWLDFPFDVQAKMVEVKEWNLSQAHTLAQYDAAPVLMQWDLDWVVKHLQEAKRPVIWAGHGVRLSGMKEEFKQLVSKLQIPVILTWSGIDLIPDKHPLYFGRAGVCGMRHSNFIVQNCDFLLVLGSRLSMLQTGYDINQFARHAKIAVVDTDQVEWTKHPSDKYSRIIHTDCRGFIPDLTKYSTPCNVPDWLAYCTKMKDKYPLLEKCHVDGGPNYLNSYYFLSKLCDYIDDDAIIVTDMGTALLSGHYAMRLKPDQLMFTSLGLGEMGYGLPGAIGAAKAFPGRQIICLNCDGGMMMNLQELQTIVYHNLPIKIVVFNNDGYLMIKHTQKMLFKEQRTAVDKKTGVGLPDFTKIAKGFGIRSHTIDSWTSFGVVGDWISKKDPALLDVFMDPEQDFVPKVRGVANEDGTITPAPLEEMSPLLPYKDIEEAMITGVSEKSKRIARP